MARRKAAGITTREAAGVTPCYHNREAQRAIEDYAAHTSPRAAFANLFHAPITINEEAATLAAVPGIGRKSTGSAEPAATIKTHMDLVTTAIKQQEAPQARVWLLLRHLDERGAGWLPMDVVKTQLTNKTSKIHICGWRRLRQILNKGEGVFWSRDKNGRIWIRSVGKVANALDIERLSGKPVAIPLKALLDGMKKVRAHFFATFHSGRRRSNPISRIALRAATGAAERTQRDYDKITGTRSTANYAVLAERSDIAIEEAAAKHGNATFTDFHDYNGQHGAKRRRHIICQLPNTYQVPGHSQAPTGRQRKINRDLKDLVNLRAQGNIKDRFVRRFYPSIKQLMNSKQEHTGGVFWSVSKGGGTNHFWYPAMR